VGTEGRDSAAETEGVSGIEHEDEDGLHEGEEQELLGLERRNDYARQEYRSDLDNLALEEHRNLVIRQ